MNNSESWEIVQKIADNIEDIYEVDNLEAFKIAIEFWKAECLHKIIHVLDSIDSSINYK